MWSSMVWVGGGSLGVLPMAVCAVSDCLIHADLTDYEEYEGCDG